MIHVQKWSAITKEDAHTMLRSWGYAGFAELGRRAPLKLASRSRPQQPTQRSRWN